MEKLDLKDRKILYELDCDSRQSFRAIGRKVGLSKDVVASRVKKLQEREIISRFVTSIDHTKLGFISLRFYFKYQYVSPAKKKEIIDHFVNYKYSTVVASIEGSYDLYSLMLVKNINEIYPFWKKTLNEFGDYFAERVFSIYAEDMRYRSSFLIDEKDDRASSSHLSLGKEVKVDSLDFNILKLIASNSRMPTLDIAKKLNSNASTINSRIKRLMDSGVINRFGVLFNYDKLGYTAYKVDIYLKEYSKIHQIIKYIEKNPHLWGIDYTLGYVDLELELILKNINHLNEIIEGILQKFPDSIRNYTYFRLVEAHKFLLLDMEK